MKRVKILSVIFAFILSSSMLPTTVSALEAETDSGSEGAIAITTPAEFLKLNDFEDAEYSGTYYLANDLDFSEIEITTPYLVDEFYGVLDGRGHTIYGFELKYEATATTENSVNMGLFGKLGGEGGHSAMISNLNIGTEAEPIQATITVGEDKSVGQIDFGFLAGYTGGAKNPTIVDVNIFGALTANVNDHTGHIAVGGFIGDAYHPDFSGCVFNGRLDITDVTTNQYRYVGGIVGMQRNRTDNTGHSLYNACENNADISIVGAASTRRSGVGGIVGSAKSSAQIIDCVNNGDIVSNEQQVGGIVGFANEKNTVQVLTLIANCANNGKINNVENSNYEIYGCLPESGTYGKRICIIDCKTSSGADSTQNTPTYDNSSSYAHFYDYIMPIGTVDELTKIGSDALYNAAGFYKITNDIDFEGVDYKPYVIQYFSGVLYGGGHTLKNLKVSNNGKTRAGFIEATAGAGDTAIMELSLGTEDAPMIFNSARYESGALIAKAGSSADGDTAYCTMIHGVDIYVRSTVGVGGTNRFSGGVIGVARSFTFVNSNVYGRISSDHDNNAYIGGFIGNNQGVNTRAKSLFLDCNNYADIGVRSNTNDKNSWVSGFVGAVDGANVYVNCLNFGNLSHSTADGVTVTAAVGAFGGHTTNSITINNCVNLGSVKGQVSATAFGIVNSGEKNYVSAIGLEDIGTVASDIEGVNSFICKNINSTRIDAYEVYSDAAISMINGAAIRLDVNTSGIRFRSVVSERAVESLMRIFGGDATISCGTIISPTDFVDRADSFTTDGLDAFAKDNGSFGDEKAYVKIPATKWFDDETKMIAGSLVDLSASMYNVEFSGRSYITVTVDGKDVFTVYSAYSAKNNSRSVATVANAAAADVLYQTGTDPSKWYMDEACTAEYTGADRTTYKTAIGEANADGVKKYSCYTSDEIIAINKIIADIPEESDQ